MLEEVIERIWPLLDLSAGQVEAPKLFPREGAIFKDATLREWVAVESTQTEYVTEPS